VLAGITDMAFIDVDSLLRPVYGVYGQHQQGTSYGHTKIAGRQVLRKGLSPLAVTTSTRTAAPVIAAMRLRCGRAGSGKDAASLITEAINTAKTAGATNILVRGDSAYGNSDVIAAVVKTGAQFSCVLTKNPAVNQAISAIAADAWTPVHYPGSVLDPDIGELISDAEVAETTYTAFQTTGHPVTTRLIVGRVKDQTTSTRCSPSGGTTRFSPTTPNPSPTQTSLTAGTPSSKRSSPTSSTAPGPTSHPDGSRPTPPGPCSPRSPRSPTTCSAPPALWPHPPWAKPAAQPCDGT